MRSPECKFPYTIRTHVFRKNFQTLRPHRSPRSGPESTRVELKAQKLSLSNIRAIIEEVSGQWWEEWGQTCQLGESGPNARKLISICSCGDVNCVDWSEWCALAPFKVTSTSIALDPLEWHCILSTNRTIDRTSNKPPAIKTVISPSHLASINVWVLESRRSKYSLLKDDLTCEQARGAGCG